MKFAENGCLLDYLQKHRKHVYSDYQNVQPDENTETAGLTYTQKLQMAHGIAKGMRYLEKMMVGAVRNV